MHHDRSNEPPSELRIGVNAFYFFARAAALPVEVFVRRFGTWGDRYLGSTSLLGLFWPPIFASMCGRDPGLPWLGLLWVAVIGLVVVHHVAGLARRARGYRCHSRYWGDSWFQQIPGFRAPRRAHALEVLGTVALAVLLFGAVSKPLGAILLLGAFAHAVNLATVYHADAARLRAMRDAEIENRYYAELYRERFLGNRR